MSKNKKGVFVRLPNDRIICVYGEVQDGEPVVDFRPVTGEELEAVEGRRIPVVSMDHLGALHDVLMLKMRQKLRREREAQAAQRQPGN